MQTFTWSSLRCCLLMLIVCRSTRSVSGGNITLALLWNEEGTAAIAEDLFQSKFLPAILQACQSVPGAKETGFKFVEIVQTSLVDIPGAIEELANLNSCLFIGAHSEVSSLLTSGAQANVSSGLTQGSVAARRYPSARLHQVAPISVPLATDGALRALLLSLGLTGSPANRRLGIVLGSGYGTQLVKRLVANFPGLVQLYWLESGRELDLIGEMKQDQSTDFLMAAQPGEAEALLLAAFKSEMLHPTYRWFLFNTQAVGINNFFGFTIISKNITSMDFGPVSTAINNKLNTTRDIYLFDLLSIWSVYLRNILCSERTEVNTTIEGMTGSFRLEPNGAVTRLNSFMHFYKGLGQQRERIGNWSSNGTFHFEPVSVRIPTDDVLRRELNMNVFRVVTLLSPPYVQYKKGFENRTNASVYDRLEGFAMDICKLILANLSLASIEVILQPDGNYGSYDPISGWNGMVSTLMQGTAGLACASMSDTAPRRGVIKFTEPIKSTQLSILYAEPDANPLTLMFEFLSPLHLYTWLALLGSALASALVLAVLHQVSQNAQQFSLYEAVYISLGWLIQGLKGAIPDRPSAQLVTVVYWLFAFVVVITYATNYAAKRTLQRIQTEITGLDSLSMQAAYEYGTVHGSVYLDFLKNSHDPLQLAAFRYITSDPQSRQPRNISHALDMVRGGGFAFIYSSILNEYYAKMTCGLSVAGSFGQDSARFGLPESAEYDGMINRIIEHLVNTGERDRLFRKYFKPPKSDLPDCTEKPLPSAISNWIPQEPEFFNTKRGALTLSNTLGIVIINLVGCLLTLLLAAMETACLVLRRRLRKLRSRWRQNAALATEETHSEDGTESHV